MEMLVSGIELLLSRAKNHLREDLVVAGRIDADALDRRQLTAHALAWLATEHEAARQLGAWAKRTGGEHEHRIARAYVVELARSLRSGVDLGPCESVAIEELGLDPAEVAALSADRAARDGGRSETWLAIGHAARDHGAGPPGYDDRTLDEIRPEFTRFVDQRIVPIAQDIHRRDVLIPMELIAQMSELNVFGLTIPEAHGGLGLSKTAMCVVTEELSRGSLGIGSLSTRSEIAAELIMGGGTDAQKAEWLPGIATGRVLPTAVFTEPNHGSDLAHIRTRAAQESDGSYSVTGQKTWITHAVRADLMTLLARTNDAEPGYAGLSMFLAPKTRKSGDAGEPEFVDPGLTGSEIKVLGYRGMKEYELSFDGFALPKEALLGGREGEGFKQLMRTFETARIQTAARAVGVARAAFEDALRYAWERIQFGRPIAEFARVGRKLGRMAARVQAARQLTLHAARMKDSGKRCDLEAGMAKLLATRVAWECADANVQIHGGNGYAEEYTASRLLADARVLSIFEGANEIQAHVIAKRLLEPSEGNR